MGALAFIGNLGATEIVIVMIIGLLLFGSRLPQVGRSLGKTLTEFKRGLRGLEDDFDRVQRDADTSLDEEARARQKAATSPPSAVPEPPPSAAGDASTAGPASPDADRPA